LVKLSSMVSTASVCRRLPALVSAVVFLAIALGCAANRVAPTDLHEKGAAAKRPRCRASRTVRQLSRQPEEKLDAVDKVSAILTTPFKQAGVSGWKDTGCNAEGVGVAVRDAQQSFPDFWTVDVRLTKFGIGGVTAPADRYLRIEIWPKTRANAVAKTGQLRKGARIAFSGPVVIDADGPYLEVHPDEGLRVVAP
jgi:hypothetical protein